MENFFFIWKYTSLDIAFWISIFVRAKLLSKQVRYRKNPLFPRCSSLFIHICIYVCVCKNWWWMMQISLLNTERLLLQRDSSFIMLSLYVNGKKVSIHKTYKQHGVGQKRGQVCIILIRNACITCQSWIHLANLSTWKWSNE